MQIWDKKTNLLEQKKQRRWDAALLNLSYRSGLASCKLAINPGTRFAGSRLALLSDIA